MCGIVGIMKFGSGSISEQETIVRALTKKMVLRGPDDEGLWSDQENCILGFRRLAILDLSPAGRQPMLTPDGRYALVFNGEIYNFQELQHELEHRGIRFRSTGDTEVILYALAEWGKEALQRFNGMFALAFYDSVQKQLLLARDHAGIKPLYYSLTGQGLVFASQYNQIMAHPWTKDLSISREAFGLYLRFGYIPAPYGLFQNTSMLDPGTWMEFGLAGNIRKGKFFEFQVFREPDLFGEEACEAVDEAITKAVKRHLVSDVPVGTFLSGGIDSPLIAAKIKELSRGDIRAFTMGISGDVLDESQDAALYAKEIGIIHTVEQATSGQALEMLEDVIASCSEPFADYSVFPTFQISRLARQHVKVMLSGDGGDELFWGYADRFVSVLDKAPDFSSPYWLRTLRWGMKKYFNFGTGYPNLRYSSIGDWYQDKHSKIMDPRLFFPELSAEQPVDFSLFQYKGWKIDETAQWLRWNEWTGHLGMVLMKVDRASMHHSLEVRVPLLDCEVVKTAGRIDWKSCLDISHRIGKLPLRAALQKRVNHQTEQKRGFEVPMNAWLRGPLKCVFQEKVLTRKDILGFSFNREEASRVLNQHLSGTQDHASVLWTLLSLVLWEEKHYKNRFLAHAD